MKRDTALLSSGSAVVAPPRSGLVFSNSLTSLQDLCENIDRLEVSEGLVKNTTVVTVMSHSLLFFLSSQLPQQMASILDIILLQHVFSLWSDCSASLRFISWLQHALGNGKIYLINLYSYLVRIYPTFSLELDSYTPGAPENPFLSNLLKCLCNLTSFLLVSHSSPPLPFPSSPLLINLIIFFTGAHPNC